MAPLKGFKLSKLDTVVVDMIQQFDQRKNWKIDLIKYNSRLFTQ
jgi:hypothetical protein